MKNGLKIDGLGVHHLKNIDLELLPGQCAGITGASGTGKTLLLRAVADLDPHEGQMWLEGQAAADVPPHQWRRQVGLLPAETAWWHDTVGAHFDAVSDDSLSALGFGRDVLAWQVSRLSTGERQRLGVLRLLMLAPRVLLLDEPTANLDDTNTRRVETLLAQYRRAHQSMLIWVSHDLDQLHRNCSCIYTIHSNGLALSRNTPVPLDDAP